MQSQESGTELGAESAHYERGRDPADTVFAKHTCWLNPKEEMKWPFQSPAFSTCLHFLKNLIKPLYIFVSVEGVETAQELWQGCKIRRGMFDCGIGFAGAGGHLE